MPIYWDFKEEVKAFTFKALSSKHKSLLWGMLIVSIGEKQDWNWKNWWWEINTSEGVSVEHCVAETQLLTTFNSISQKLKNRKELSEMFYFSIQMFVCMNICICSCFDMVRC